MKAFRILFFLLILSSSSVAKQKGNVKPGAYEVDLYFPLLKGKTIGVVANQTSTIYHTHLVDSLLALGIKISRVFAPEHGFRGDKSAGEKILNSTDEKTGIEIVSLYGKHLRPDSSDLAGIDLIVFDIQDVGVRFYTYISTLQYVMEACASRNIKLLILDRPNPNGFYVDGPVLEKKYKSFIGMQSIPVVYGMTIGEYAKMLNGEGWLKNKMKCELVVIPVANYYHNAKYELPVAPSPNLPDMDAVYLYPSICYFEGTAVSLGRGTDKPFHLIGYPGNKSGGIFFTPRQPEGSTIKPPYMDTLCTGLDLSGEGKNVAEQRGINLKWLLAMYSTFTDKNKFFTPFFEKLSGTASLRKQIIANKSEEEIKASWKEGIRKFKIIRKKYLMYPDFE